MPDAAGLELLAQELNGAHPGSVTGTSFHREQACLIADPGQVLAVLGHLRERSPAPYTFLASVHGADYLPHTPRFGVHYELLSMERVERLRVKAPLEDPATPDVPDALPAIDSCVELFPTANFQEREVFDFFGIVFNGHPDLRRILMPEQYEGFPQRRDFAIGGEPVLFTHNEHEVPRWYD